MTIRMQFVRIAVALTLLATTPPAHSDSRSIACADRDQLITRLEERYGETLQSVGLQHNNEVLEVYASDSTGTWTILVTHPDGNACLVASGQMWEKLAAPQVPAGDDA
jgi:hypothetical protein